MSKCLYCGASAEPIQDACPACGKPLLKSTVHHLAQSLWQKSVVRGHGAQQSIRTVPPAKTGLPSAPLRLRKVSSDPARGTDSDYELLRVLGQGGMGLVYEARQTAIDRPIALKMMLPDPPGEPARQDLFLAEALVTGRLDHPNIVPIHDLGRDDDGRPIYAMREVKGRPWSEAIRTNSQRANLDVLMRVCDAVAFAHSRGIIHRDLKPQNVMLGEFGEVVVMDWGLAATVQGDAPAMRVTEQTAFCGTPAYMAPEMALGMWELIGPRSDVYLLGAILFEIVAGTPPHLMADDDAMDALGAAALNKIRETKARGELLDVALRAMADAPVNRHASVKEFQAAVLACLDHQESERLAAAAADKLAAAATSKLYEDFAEALFGYRQALRIWPENRLAREGLNNAQIRYAEVAMAQNDLDLALSLLDAQNDAQRGLLAELRHRIAERDRQLGRIRALRRTIAAGSALLLLLAAASAVWINRERLRATAGERAAGIALHKSERLLSESLEAQAARDISQGNHLEALALLASAMRHDPSNRVAAGRAIDVLSRENWLLPVFDAARLPPDFIWPDTPSPPVPFPRRRVELEQNFNTAFLKVVPEDDPENVVGPPIGPYDNPQTAVCSGAIGPDGRFVAFAAGNRLLHLYDRFGQSEAFPPRPTDTYVLTLEFSPRAHALAVGTKNGHFEFIDLADGSRHRQPFFGGDRWGGSFHPDRSLFAFFSGQNPVYADYRPSQSIATVLRAGRINVGLFASNGERVVLADGNGEARYFCARSGRPLGAPIQAGSSIRKMAISPDGRSCALATHLGELLLVPLDGESAIVRTHGHSDHVEALAFAPNGGFLASGGSDGHLRISCPTSLVALADIDLHRWIHLKEGEVPSSYGQNWRVEDIAISADSKRLLAAVGDYALLWKDGDWQSAPHLFASRGFVRAADVSPDGRYGAYVDIEDGHIVDLETGRTLAIVEGHNDSLWQTKFNPQGNTFATVSGEGSLRLWKLDGTPTTPFLKIHDGKPGGAATLAFSPDGAWVAAGCGQGVVRVWDASNGREIVSPLKLASDRISSVHFSPDNRRLLATSFDGTATLVDLVPITDSVSWLPDLAEAVGGLVATASGFETLEWTARERIMTNLYQRAAALPPNSAVDEWLRWFWADRGRRTLSPWSSETVPEALERLLRSIDAKDLNAALELAPNDPRIYLRMADALWKKDRRKALFMAALARDLDPSIVFSPETTRALEKPLFDPSIAPQPVVLK